MIDTIIFDAEGVVIDTEALWDRSQEEFLKRRGFAYNRDIVKPLLFIEGFKDFYQIIQAKYKTCIATAMDSELLSIADERLGLSKLFRGNLCSIAEVGYVAKPQPDIFLHAARRLGSQVEQCLVIEDAPLGVEAAKRAGMRCIGLTTTYRREQLAQADFVVVGYAQIDLDWF